MTIATRGQEQSAETTDSNQVSTSEQTTSEDAPATDDTSEPLFPNDKLVSLDEKISSIRWVVPVLPDQELECLLRAAIDLCRTGADLRSDLCQRFFREGLTISFTKILTDDAVPGWKPNIHQCINQNCLRLIELCVLKLAQDWFPLLDLLAMVLNPNCKFHTFNATRQSESTVSNPAADLYARCGDLRNVRGWLVDLINRFGELGGFSLLLERFQSGSNLTVSVVYSLLRPFGLCYEYLTPNTINKYLLPILELVPSILGKLTDDELKREAKNEAKSDIVSAIIKSSKNLASRVSNQEELIRVLEGFRLKMILRQLQISSFNGKMNALNEINKVISSVTYYPNRHCVDEEEYLTPEKMACWINENKVLEIVLRDSLHQPQYVEKLEKILRFVIKESALSVTDLDAVWSAQVGKHEAIVKNVHDLLAKLAWDFSPDQLDHLFECFQTSWTSASRRQRERLLELIRRLAEDDKDGDMAYKVLTLFWNLAHSEDAPTEMLDQALTAHIKILDYSCSQERDAQKTVWIDKCVGEIKISDKWVIPALKQIREICLLYEPTPNGGVHPQRGHHLMYRQEVIERLQSEHSLVVLVTNNLTGYMEKLRAFVQNTGEHVSGESYVPDGRYPHVYQVQERLNFLRFLLKDGQLWLCAEQAKQIWLCLAENAVFASDREACFKWFAKLMGEEPDLDPGINKDFFENNILMIDQLLLTESGIKCFERFFKAVNTKEGKLKEKRRCLLTEDPDLIGLDYLWKVVTLCPDDIASRAIELLREVSTNLGPRLAGSQLEFHETYITECFDRLRAHYDTIIGLQRNTTTLPQPVAMVNTSSSSSSLGSVSSVSSTFSSSERDFSAEQIQVRIRLEAVKLCRVLHVLHEYLSECDSNYTGTTERRILPLHRACRGKHMSLIVRFTNANNRQVDDIEIYTHSNDTLASLRKSVLRKIKSSEHFKVELFIAGETLEFANDHKLLSQLPIRDKMIISAKVSQVNLNMASSQDSSSDSSTSSPQHPYESPTTSAGVSGTDPLSTNSTQQPTAGTTNAPGNTTNSSSSGSTSNSTGEHLLPGVIMSMQPAYAAFFCQLSALGSRLQYPALRDGARSLLQLMPSDTATIERLLLLFHHHGGGGRVIGAGARAGPGGTELTVESMFFSATPAEVLYNLEVLYALLMPAIDPFSDKSYRIQYNFLVSGEAHTFLEMFTKNNFMCGADTATARSAYLVVLKICKLIVTAVAHVLVRLAEDHTQVVDGMVGQQGQLPTSGTGLSVGSDGLLVMTPGMHLKQALRFVPCPSDQIVRQVSLKLSQSLADLITSAPSPHINPAQSPPPSSTLFHLALNWDLPDLNTIRALVRLIWAASSANLRTALNLSADQLHSLCDPTKRNAQLELHRDDVLLCKEALEVLSVALVLNPSALEELCRKGGVGLSGGSVDKGSNLNFHMFVTDMVLLNPSRSVRIAAGEQFILICTYGSASRTALQLIAPLLFSLLDNLVPENARTSHEFFQLLCRLVNASFLTSHPLPATQQLLTNEITWLRSARGQHDTLLEGHLCLTRELLCFMTPEQKCELGSADCGSLIKELVEDFLFPASKLALQLQKSGKLGEDPGIPICESPQTQAAAFEVLLVLCGNCVENCRQLVGMLNEMFYTDPETAILEWDYLPAIGPRPQQGFVGLKNAGATCYMNSVLQQLYMVASIREGILSCEGAATDPREDFSGDDRSNIGHIIDFNRDRDSREAPPRDRDSISCRDRDILLRDNSMDVDEADSDEKEDKEKRIAGDYNVGILKQVQAIFGHLACSRLQYYVPRGLWRHFKLQGEPVNLREQQDAVEFFMALVESLDEALKLLGLEQIMSKILGGSYSDQKICKGCPHRYSKEEPFSVISVDIRNHSSLQDSMEQYVKGELLEGADAYHCDKCQTKVVTVKRLCVKKLPPVLAIQLKRFEYDFERVCAIKFNDYFEFPRHLDMEPYTVSGLAKVEGEVIDVDVDASAKETCTRYELTGIVVHSGQASGGHYYSYIRSRDPSTFPPHPNSTTTTTTATVPDNTTAQQPTTPYITANVSSGNVVQPAATSGCSSGGGGGGGDSSHWYKFDDGEVSACAMSDDDEMKMQCFGGDYMAEVFDPVMKRTSYRRQKRWWNAYMLFYTRLDVEEADLVNRMSAIKINDRKEPKLRMPPAIEHSIRKQNIKFLHHRNQFNVEYFNFIRKLVTTTGSNSSTSNGNGPGGQRSGREAGNSISAIEVEQLNMLSTQLAARFLFHTGWHTKKTLRGPAMEWCDLLCVQLRSSLATRGWFAMQILFAAPHRFAEYLLACPSNEVRIAFVKIVVLLAHFSIGDPSPPGMMQLQQQHASSSNHQGVQSLGLVLTEHASLSDHILAALLRLLQGEAVGGEHGGRHLAHYCNVFHMYANQGIQEREQLLKLNVPATFMLVALDEGPVPVIKYQYAELAKLNQVVTCLVRCCDVSSKCQSSTGGPILPNPHRESSCQSGYIMPLSIQAYDILYSRSSYIKKVIEDSSNAPEDAMKLLQYCSWENPHFSRTVLSELLWQISFAFCNELRHHMDLLLSVLLLEDSWQSHRIHNAVQGVPDERDGLLETIAKSRDHYQKRGYQCLKCLVSLFLRSRTAKQMLMDNGDVKRKYQQAVSWLEEELDRKYPNSSQYPYNSWSPPAQSNEISNGYVLERSNSARKTLERALEILPELKQQQQQQLQQQRPTTPIMDFFKDEDSQEDKQPQQQQQPPPDAAETANTSPVKKSASSQSLDLEPTRDVPITTPTTHTVSPTTSTMESTAKLEDGQIPQTTHMGDINADLDT